LMVDPLLAETIAFRLSVAASAGIVWLSKPIERRLRGADWLRALLSVTLGAQLAVAPFLVTTFGPVSVVSVPANVLAGPLAGLIMGWGMTAGFIAGVAPSQLATAIHLPTRAGLACLEGIARLGSSIPFAPVGVVWITAACGTALVWNRLWSRRIGRLLGFAAVVALAIALLPGPTLGAHRVGYDSRVAVTTENTTLTLGSEGNGVNVAVDLLKLSIRHIDTIVMGQGSDASIVSIVSGRITIGHVVDAEETSDLPAEP
ncbi:MAG: ComEC/Rec2 family competence protein, partial [Acidimicrobiales bacterium]